MTEYDAVRGPRPEYPFDAERDRDANRWQGCGLDRIRTIVRFSAVAGAGAASGPRPIRETCQYSWYAARETLKP
jgi:hypothetical protein